LALFSTVDDDLGLAHTYYLVSWIHWLQSRAKPTQAAYEHVLRHARKANSRALMGRAMIQQMGPLYFGPFALDEIRTLLERLEAEDSMLGRIAVLSVRSALAEREGRYDEAFALLEDAGALHAELGVELGIVIAMQRRAELLLDAGRLEESQVAFREVIERLEALAMTSFRSTTTIALGEVVYKLGDADEAERLALEGEELGAAEDVVNFASSRSLRARIVADRGDHAAAETLARDALEDAYKTDFPGVQANAHEALAHVLAAAGRQDAARTELRSAQDLWSRYGYRVRAERVGELLVEL
jgi:ATP/maltotriose-dependent transcriptional regulator MalT